MVLIKNNIVQASDYLLVLNEENSGLIQEYVDLDVPISEKTIDNLTLIYENPESLETLSDFKSIPELFQTASFLQMPLMTELLVKFLNKLCQYDNPALVSIHGSINLYWLGDQCKLKAATKVWLGLLTLPLKEDNEDESCFSSTKLLSGKPFCSQLVENIVKYTNDEDVCIELLEPMDIPPFDKYFFISRPEFASEFGRLKVLERYFRLKQSTYTDPKICVLAARNGHLHVLKWLIAHSCPWHEDICSNAALNGHFEILKWARTNGCPWNEDTCAKAALYGNLEVLQWARSQQPPCPWDVHTCFFAARNGHFEVLKWARENGCPWNGDTCNHSALNGHLDILKWARANGCPWGEKTCTYSALNGHLETLKWAHANGCPFEIYTFTFAAENGNLEILQWLYENKCPWDKQTCAHAAKYGNLEALQWLRAKNCPWDKSTCTYAAENGHLDVLKWARGQEPQCPWDCETYYSAKRNGHSEVLKWARENGCFLI